MESCPLKGFWPSIGVELSWSAPSSRSMISWRSIQSCPCGYSCRSMRSYGNVYPRRNGHSAAFTLYATLVTDVTNSIIWDRSPTTDVWVYSKNVIPTLILCFACSRECERALFCVYKPWWNARGGDWSELLLRIFLSHEQSTKKEYFNVNFHFHMWLANFATLCYTQDGPWTALLLVQSVIIVQYVPPTRFLNMKSQQRRTRCATKTQIERTSRVTRRKEL